MLTRRKAAAQAQGSNPSIEPLDISTAFQLAEERGRRSALASPTFAPPLPLTPIAVAAPQDSPAPSRAGSVYHTPQGGNTPLHPSREEEQLIQMDVSKRPGESNTILPFDGSDRVDVRTWSAQVQRETSKIIVIAHANGKPTPHAADLVSHTAAYIAPDSPAEVVMAQIREATNSYIEKAEEGFYLDHAPSTAVIKAMLGSNAHVQQYIDAAEKKLRDKFEPIMRAALLKDVLVSASEPDPDAGTQTSTQPTGTTPFLSVKGERVSPHMYAYQYVIAVFEIRYSIASLDRENEFKSLKQGTLTLDQYATELRRRAALVQHLGIYDEPRLTLMFLQGLSDQNCAKKIADDMSALVSTAHTLQDAVNRAEQWQRFRQSQLQVLAETAVAEAMLKGGSSGTVKLSQIQLQGSPAAAVSGSTRPAPTSVDMGQLKRQLQQAALARYGPNHRDSPCTLPNHRGHSNGECNVQQRQHQAAAGGRSPLSAPVPAGAVQSSIPQAAVHGSSSSTSSHWHAAAAVNNSAAPLRQSSSAGPAAAGTQQRWWNQQKQASAPAPEAAAQQNSCTICGYRGGHGAGNCYYDQPQLAPASWRPSANASHKAMEAYRKRCAELNKQPLEPYPSDTAPRTAAGLTQDAETPANPEGEPMSWLLGCGLLSNEQQKQCPYEFMPHVAAHMHDQGELVSAVTRKKEPHSYIPQDNTVPRQQAVHFEAPSSSSVVPQVSLTITMPAVNTVQVGQQLSQIMATFTPSPSDAQHSPAAAATKLAVGAAGTPVIPSDEGELDRELDLKAKAALLADLEARCRFPHLHLFTSPSYAEGVSLHFPDGRHTLVPRAAADSGCIPSIITEQYANSIGLTYANLSAAEQLRVRYIDGTSTARIFARTQPLTVKLAEGTPYEVSLQMPRGFLVVKGEEAHAMYDLVLGRDLLDKVSGYVVPVQQAFFYYPTLQSLDFSTHSLPVITGKKILYPHAGSSAAALADAMTYLPACSAILQDPDLPEPMAADAAAPSHSAPAATARHPGITSHLVWMLLSVLMLTGWALQSTLKTIIRCARCCQHLCLAIWNSVLSGFALLYFAASQQAPWRSTLYWRIGRDHRAADGTRIRLRSAKGHSGHKPRCVNVHTRALTWQHVRQVWSARALILLILVGAALISGAAAGHIVQNAFTPVCARAHWAPLLLPIHYDPRHSLVADVNDDVGGTFRC